MKDVVIVGGGHNGLVCAAYLAMNGLSVTVLERRHIVGGAAVTEEFHPGFRNSVASYTVSLLNPKVIADLRLAEHGLKVVERELANFIPLPDGRYLKTGGGVTKEEVAKFSARDAGALDLYDQRTQAIADVLRDLVLRTPPNVVGGRGWSTALPELLKMGGLANKVRGLGIDLQRELLDLFAMSAGDYLDRTFESDPIKAAFGWDSIVGNFASPYTPGSAYVLLHHVFGEVNGKKGSWGHAIGGMGAITQAMAKAAQSFGVEIRTDAPVREILIEKGRACGAVLESGEAVRGGAVISNLNPRLLFTKLVDSSEQPVDFHRRISSYRCGSGTFRMNVALSELPDFSALPGKEKAPHHTSGILIAPSLNYMEEAYMDARRNGWPKNPVVELCISSTLDDTLAPNGMHVASMFCQHVSPTLPDGSSWDLHREKVADLMIDTVNRYAPNFKNSVIGRQINSPLDLERTFGLVGGDIFHGQLDLNQLFSARPVLGHADYRSPIDGLYMCGSGTHPGGGVTGAPGHNAAHEVIRDFKRRRLRRA